MMSICKHGQLARSCTVCDEIAQAREYWLEQAAKVCEALRGRVDATPKLCAQEIRALKTERE